MVVPSTAALRVSEALKFTATPRDASGAALNRAVTWRSESPAVATADSGGLVTAIAPGNAVITATSDGKVGTAVVTVVRPPVVAVEVVAPAEVTVGDSLRLTTIIHDSTGAIVADRPITWSVSDSARALVTPAGVLQTKGSGIVTVTATVESVRGLATLRLTYPIRYLDSRAFDAGYYLEANPDLAAVARTALEAREHWLLAGLSEGRRAHRNVAVQEYLALNDEARSRTGGDYVAAVNDYLTIGIPTGLHGIAAPILNVGATLIPVLAQPTLAEQPVDRVMVSFWNMGPGATGERPSADLSRWTGLAVPSPRADAQWSVPGWNPGQGGSGPAAVQIYNGWVGISNDSRTSRPAWEALNASPDTPIDINLSYQFPGNQNTPKPFVGPNRGLVWEADMQIPTAGRTGSAASYAIQYFFLRDDLSNTFVAYGTVLFDIRGGDLPGQYIAYDACSLCTQFMVISSHLGLGPPWHKALPGSATYTGQSYAEIRRIGLTIDAAQFIEGIKAAKQRFPALAGLSEDPATWHVTTWVLDVEVGALTRGDAWIGASVRVVRAGLLQ